MVGQKRVLVTGINGFAGRYVAAELKNLGYFVVGFSHTSRDGGASLTDINLEVDLRSLSEVRRAVGIAAPDYVIHLAAIAFVDHGDISDMFLTNVIGSKNLLTAISELEKKPLAVVMTSSANVYGNSDKELLSEIDVPRPVNDYAISKLAMELVCCQFFSSFRIIITRPFNYTGVGQSTQFLVPKIVNEFKRKSAFIELGNTNISRDFSDVRFFSKCSVELLLSNIESGSIVNICSGNSISLQEIINICSDITGHQMEIRSCARFMRGNEILKLSGDVSKLSSMIDINIENNMADTLKWMLEN